MTDHDLYFEHLRSRKQLGLWYRRLWLYPRLCRHLRGKVLDVGCGIGDMVRFRAGTTGVDVNPKAVAYCRETGLDAVLMQPGHIPFGDRDFAGVVLDNVLEHLEEPSNLLAEIRRVLSDDGTLVVGVPGSRGFACDPDHKRHYPESELIERLASAGFEPAALFHQPFRSRFLDRHLRYYAVYGVFRKALPGTARRLSSAKGTDRIKSLITLLFLALALQGGAGRTMVQLFGYSLARLENWAAFDRELHKPAAGLQLVPKQALIGVSMMQQQGVAGYRLAPSLMKQDLIRQRIEEIAWPIPFDPASPFVLSPAHDTDPACARLSSAGGLALDRCD